MSTASSPPRARPSPAPWDPTGLLCARPSRRDLRPAAHLDRHLGQPSGPPAWADIRSWALVGTVDRVILPATQLFMAERAGARIVKVKASHLSMLSQPGAVTRLILTAARATS
jgi:pimeloyl-ACP methyl ester carboxylesterase